MDNFEYIDNYATCLRTYATFCIQSRVHSVDYIADLLSVTPTSVASAEGLNGWYLSSKSIVSSRDLRRHIDWLLETMKACSKEIYLLQANGCTVSVSCFWSSSEGQGGPIISHHQIKSLNELKCDLKLDIYYELL